MSAWRIKVLIDGACPLCRREADLWRRLDAGRGRIALEDVTSANFDPGAYGLTHARAREQIHGILPTGAVVRGMEVFRRAYAAVGWGWLVAPTGWPLLRPVFDRAYRWFARHRLRLTGRWGRCEDRCSVGNPPANFERVPRDTVGGA
ncbi:MAG TPA: DUF393 domain-containing protein [Phycisphaerae bacterium]|nr:DUF393 domain-containing protein [Phycisphaerae bacterium]HNU44866.1 DUF393 domain-containing protein [Phycisphaerae bacterium]